MYDTAAAPCAVIVTFNPDRAVLRNLIERLRAQVPLLVVVDNASADDVSGAVQDRLGAGIALIQNADNLGLGAGFNLGIGWARGHGATHAILFDQDSAPEADMVERLLAGERRLLALGIAVAAVGPRFVDVKSGQLSAVVGPERFYTRKKPQADFELFREAGYLISSGKLIRMAALDQIGAMRADFFIDAIDIEWCLRAQSRGRRCFTVDDARMTHNIGERTVRIGATARPLHGPLRHYYIIRNALLLLRSADIPWQWKVTDAFKTARRLVAYPLFSRAPWQDVKAMARGLRDGILGRSGKA